MARTYETFTTSGTWEVPAGITEVIVVCYGAGGVGGLGTTLHGGIPGPGGGGGASSKTTLTVTPGDTISYTIGAGATYTSYIGNIPVGGYGGDTSAVYNSSTVCLAKGGRVTADGLSGGLGGSASSGTGDFKVSGGNGSSGDSSYGGGGGSAGSCSAIDGDESYTEAGNNGGNPTGGTATTIYSGSNGGGGAGGQSGHVAGYIGGNYGGGGGGTSPLGTFDDADKPGSGANGFIEFSYADSTTYGGGGNDAYSSNVFLNFNNIQVPNKAVIQSAFIRFTAKTSLSQSTVNAYIEGNYVDNAVSPTNTQQAQNLLKTEHAVAWLDVVDWTSNSTYDSPEIKCVIQDIVDRSGWSAGNNILLLVSDYGSTGTGTFITRSAYDYSEDSAKAAELIIYYTLDETGSGGTYVDGSAVVALISDNTYNEVSSGGAYCAGSAAIGTFNYNQIMSGGVEVSGFSILSLPTPQCNSRGSGTMSGNLVSVQIANSADDGFFTTTGNRLEADRVSFGYNQPIV